MIRAEELMLPTSCLNKAQNDEPIFVLRANDEMAPMSVRTWARMYILSKGIATPAQVAKYNEALKLADEMERWREKRIAETVSS